MIDRAWVFGVLLVGAMVAACADDGGEPAEQASDAGASGDDAQRAPKGPCDIDTGWAGDDNCLEPPDPQQGFQLHFGPQRYDDEAEIAKYILGPHEEKLLCTYVTTPNEVEAFYDDWKNTLRPGSHHMIVAIQNQPVEAAEAVPCGEGGLSSLGLLGGNSTALEPFEETAPENEGLGRVVPPRAAVELQLHFFNTTDEPVLMEAWQNIYYKDPAEVTETAAPIEAMAGLGMSVEPGTTEIIAGRIVAPQPLRVVDLYSHNHNHTLRFSAYLVRAGQSERTRIYESYDWEHPLYIALDSIHENDAGDPDNEVPGGHTGELMLQKGDALEWECEIFNHDLAFPLTFANRANDAEMCILRGNYAPSLGRAWSTYVF